MIARFLLMVVLAAACCPMAWAVNPLGPIGAGGITGLDLQTQLERGLYVRRPVEFQYVAEIIKLVEEGKLPRDLVATTFTWARAKPSRQLQYFQFALEARARGLPVKLPNLRHQAVGISTNGGEHGVNTPPLPQRLPRNFGAR